MPQSPLIREKGRVKTANRKPKEEAREKNMEIGKRQFLEVVRKKEFGYYLSDPGDREGKQAVLLPIKEIKEGEDIGSRIEIFLYRDSNDRLIATKKRTLIERGKLARLKVKEVSKIGAFVDIGLEKDVLLPFKEMEGSPAAGDEVLAALYLDRSERLALTMRVYPYLRADSPYRRDDFVRGTIYRIRDIGLMVAVEDQYYGMVPASEVFDLHTVGENIEFRVLRVREDGKLDLSPRKKAYLQMDEDAARIMESLEKKGDILEIGDKSSPEKIKSQLGLSKNAFKRAAGHLMKKGLIKIYDQSIEKTGEKRS